MVSIRVGILAAALLSATVQCVLAEETSTQFSWTARTTARVQVLTPDDLKDSFNGNKDYVPSDTGLKTVVRPLDNTQVSTGAKDKNDGEKETPSKATQGKKDPHKMVTIGRSTFPKKLVTAVGDIDNNGFTDYIVADPNYKKDTGSIRLYLMNEKGQFLFSRELVPGNWGFEGASLQTGDMFGSAVFKLPSTATASSCVVAVGAPGDNANGRKTGAIYILKISGNGSVSMSRKVSAETDASLSRQHEEKEGFGTNIRAIGDINGDGDFELAVKSLLGSTTMLFLNSKHEVKTSLKVYNSDIRGLMDITEKYEPTARGKLDSTQLDSISIRATAPGQCFFNETSCACGMKPPEKASASCLDVVGTDPGSGRTLCKARDCEASYACSCDGTELCNRVETTAEVYSPEESAGGNEVFCSKKPITRFANVVQVGAPIPTPAAT